MDNDIQRLRAARLKRDALRARRTEKARRLLPHIVDRLRRLQAHFKPAATGVRAELLQRLRHFAAHRKRLWVRCRAVIEIDHFFSPRSAR